MVSVLGVSVGASAVRVAYPDDRGAAVRTFPVDPAHERPEDVVADSVDTVIAENAADDVQTIGVAYRDQAQAAAVEAAIADCRLVPEVTAALRMLEASGELGDHSTLLLYDLGSSGLTVTVVDRESGTVFGSSRTDEIGGDLVDRLIRDHQLQGKRIAAPADEAGESALAARCRRAKEELSTNTAVCVPGDGGLLLLSQDVLESLIVRPVEASARLAREVIASSGHSPDVVVLIGGGAHIPLVASLMESWLALPVIVPAQPELVAAEGAALLAQEHSGTSVKFARPVLRGGALAGGALAVVAVIGLGLGVGGSLMQGSDGDARPVATQPSNVEVSPSPARPSAATLQPSAAVSVPDASQQEVSAPEPAPVPAPAPRPLIPGLPQIQLPTLPPPPPLPPLPRIPGL
ncbi:MULTISPECIES: Hsp70 family protein [unclassified Rhodococcus (in: high G+C Gram-positive bacteria)]|uniref:Hsp70 family protein n=1 Tax=unclassified Rhodococcus (in: high G+C Gram-positive bacteria) TaxID=192944 RepID=UPI00163977A6|nr:MULTISPECIES: Hsp70 family protein [unclassified Rhodococcus (in: high G+C Gram-positive bacteria)]MBC2641134.1 Hsp70 family protein [Rhodococcus sp. 3A]MBC2894121.1 Hsp70 family protein [Rhodococcus sp. 4CII]